MSKLVYERTKNDINIEFRSDANRTNTVSRDLGSNNVSSWKITGNLQNLDMENGFGNNAYIDVVDISGKVLTTIHTQWQPNTNNLLFCNNVSVAQSVLPHFKENNSFELSITSGAVSFIYGGYLFPVTTMIDSTAEWNRPKTLRFRFDRVDDRPNFSVGLNAGELRFYKESVVPPNQPPIANAGADTIIMLPTNSATLYCTGTDVDGTISSYAWAKLSGPTGGTIASASAATTAVNNLVQGVYQYKLTVTDNNGASGKDTVQITVNAQPPNLLPAVNPANTVNGLDYKYYEGSWSFLPAFTSLNPDKTGATPNFDISLANRPEQYGLVLVALSMCLQTGNTHFTLPPMTVANYI